MKLFKIGQTIHRGWDTFSDAVVVAPDEATVKTIHPNSMHEYFEGWPFVPNADDSNFLRNDWADTPDQVKAEYIGEAAEHLSQGAIICASFHTG